MKKKCWFENYGWKKNPFEIKPNPILIGMDLHKEKLYNFVLGGGISFLTGLPGTGKTSMLEWLQRVHREGTVVYLDSKHTKDNTDVTKNIKKSGPLWRRIFGMFPKNVIILVDEAQLASEDVVNDLESLWDHNKIKALVLTQTEEDLQNYPTSFKERLGQRIIRLDTLRADKVRDLLSIRVKGHIPFDDDALKSIAHRSSYIPRKILENCEIACIELNGQMSIGREDIERVFSRLREEEIQQQVIRLERKNAKIITPLDRIEYSDQFTPLQKRMIKVMMESNKTTAQLADILKTSVGSIGKQLNELMNSKWIEIINNRRPKVFGLSKNFKKEFMLISEKKEQD